MLDEMTTSEPTREVDERTLASKQPLLEVRDLSIEVRQNDRWVRVVDDMALSLERGRALGIVGESGCGKSLTASAIAGVLPFGTRVAGGAILFEGVDLTTLSRNRLSKFRGPGLSMIFQDPHNSLDPAFTIANQLVETIRAHSPVNKKAAREEAVWLLNRVGIVRAAERLGDYPHQLSGGMAQRVMIAMAIANRPKLLIADEPTTALDVSIQAQVLRLLKDLQSDFSMSLLLISHDISVIAEMVDHVGVMYTGQFVEHGPVRDVLRSPSHPYTEALLLARPRRNHSVDRLPMIPGTVPPPGARPGGCRFRTRCHYAIDVCAQEDPPLIPSGAITHRCVRAKELTLVGVGAVDVDQDQARSGRTAGERLVSTTDLSCEFTIGGGLFSRGRGTVIALDEVSFDVARGETLGIVGESGAGKSTLGRVVLGLVEPSGGELAFEGEVLEPSRWKRRAAVNQGIQVVYQNPYASLDPLMTIGDTLSEPLRARGERASSAQTQARIVEHLARVGLDESYVYRYPGELSGGQRQRVAIARALIVGPQLVVCDEPVHALDVSTQAQVLNLLKDLQDQTGVSYLFIGHDLSVVYHMSDRMVVMYRGQIVESGPSDDVYLRARHPYTRLLVSSVLSVDPDDRQLGTVSIGDREHGATLGGCVFANRCPHADDHCRAVEPDLLAVEQRHVRCHKHAELE